MYLLALSGSPRRGGNTDVLVERAVAGAREAGAEVEPISIRSLQVAACVECGGCDKEGVCIVQDEFQELIPKIERAERLLVATPMFFGHMSAQTKAVIDRCQCFWARKYVLRRPMPSLRHGRVGYLLAVAGHPKIKFDCMALTMRVLMDSLGGEYAGALTFNSVDRRGDAVRHPTALKDAYRFGQSLVQPG